MTRVGSFPEARGSPPRRGAHTRGLGLEPGRGRTPLRREPPTFHRSGRRPGSTVRGHYVWASVRPPRSVEATRGVKRLVCFLTPVMRSRQVIRASLTPKCEASADVSGMRHHARNRCFIDGAL